MKNYTDTIMPQFAANECMNAIISAFNSSVDPSANIDDFLSDTWLVSTAKRFGLECWAKIVDISGTLPVDGGDFFGFSEGSWFGFGQESFYRQGASSGQAPVSDAVFRLLILAKALSNISGRSVTDINRLLMQLFPGRGNAFVQDIGNMSMGICFEFALEPYEISIIKYSKAISGPTGVFVYSFSVDQDGCFGFASDCEGFGNGTFLGGVL